MKQTFSSRTNNNLNRSVRVLCPLIEEQIKTNTHVLRFMDMQNLLCIKDTIIGTIPSYERTERVVVNYAEKLGYPVGYLDWAIWATMRAARELGF